MTQRLTGQLRLNEPMSKHTSWKVGGAADQFYRPANCADLQVFLAERATDTGLFWVGLGSNLLVRDGGVRGTVICTSGVLNECEFVDAKCLRVEAGVSCARVARISARAGYAGAEFFAGIPGTMGGALAMNAGAFGGETWDLVTHVDVIDASGRVRRRPAAEFDVSYRSVNLPNDEWFVASYLALRPDAVGGATRRIRELLADRAASQPIGKASCGSVFRNPPGDYAARLIESCGLKGKGVGDAYVSPKHANFIINRGNATAADIERLIDMIRETVYQQCNVLLQHEVRIIGEPMVEGDGIEQ